MKKMNEDVTIQQAVSSLEVCFNYWQTWILATTGADEDRVGQRKVHALHLPLRSVSGRVSSSEETRKDAYWYVDS